MKATALEQLTALRDEEYAAFLRRIVPNVPPERILGVRTPQLRALAKTVDVGEAPHIYFEENQLHSFSICNEKSFDRCIERVEAFLPFVDNWATCDQLAPKVFAKNADRLTPYIEKWLASDHPYTVRFAIEMRMTHFLDERFDPAFLEPIAAIRSEEYYVKMMVAWFFATSLTKQWDATLPILTDRRLDPWTHNKAIQKARESRCIPDDKKAYLQTLKQGR